MKTINAKDIEGYVPASAEYAMFNPSGKFIQKFYKINKAGVPVYYGEQGGWHASFSHTTASIMASPSFKKILHDA